MAVLNRVAEGFKGKGVLNRTSPKNAKMQNKLTNSPYVPLRKADINAGKKWLNEGGGPIADAGQWGTRGSWVKANWQNAALDEGRSVLGMAGSHALRGAAFGGIAGGTIEAAQGGSFWDGAKQGAFNGAAGWTGYRMGMKGVGATSRNPFNKEGGMLAAGRNMMRATSKDGDVSKSVTSILNTKQIDGVNRMMMNMRKAQAQK